MMNAVDTENNGCLFELYLDWLELILKLIFNDEFG